MKFEYFKPESLEELFEGIEGKGKVSYLAGGTDLIVKVKQEVLQPQLVVDLQGIAQLKGMSEQADTITIGALETHSNVENAQVIKKHAAVLAEAAGEVGATQIKNMGTVGGNICNASPAADTVPALMALDALVTLVKAGNRRQMPLKDLFNTPSNPHIEEGEVLESIEIKKIKENQGAAFAKIGKRKSMAISVINAASFLQVNEDKITDVRIILGSVAAKAIRMTQAEEFLMGKAPTAENFEQAGQLALEGIKPIDDVRSTKEYRLATSKVLVKRTLAEAYLRI